MVHLRDVGGIVGGNPARPAKFLKRQLTSRRNLQRDTRPRSRQLKRYLAAAELHLRCGARN